MNNQQLTPSAHNQTSYSTPEPNSDTVSNTQDNQEHSPLDQRVTSMHKSNGQDARCEQMDSYHGSALVRQHVQEYDASIPLNPPLITYGTLNGEFVPMGVDDDAMPVRSTNAPQKYKSLPPFGDLRSACSESESGGLPTSGSELPTHILEPPDEPIHGNTRTHRESSWQTFSEYQSQFREIDQLIHHLGPASKYQGMRIQVHEQVLSPFQERVAPFTGLLDTLHFANLQEAVSAMRSQPWRTLTSDTSIPTTDLQRQEYVLQLLNAINNTADVCDAQSTNYRKRWGSLSVASNYYSATEKEFVAWEIFSLAEALHRHGPVVFMSFDPIFWRNASRTRDWSFAERIEKITELLRISKARCEKLLAGQSMQAVVAHPMYLVRMTKGNQKQNGLRQEDLTTGRAVLKKA